MIRIETAGWYVSNIHAYIAPFSKIQDVLSMFPCTYDKSFEANFNIKSGTHNSPTRWGGILYELLKVAKFHKTYLYNPSIFSDYEIEIENKLFWGALKYKISLDPTYRNNGKKGKIKIITGQPKTDWGTTFLACESEIADAVRRIYEDIGLTATNTICEDCKTYTNLT